MIDIHVSSGLGHLIICDQKVTRALQINEQAHLHLSLGMISLDQYDLVVSILSQIIDDCLYDMEVIDTIISN